MSSKKKWSWGILIGLLSLPFVFMVGVAAVFFYSMASQPCSEETIQKLHLNPTLTLSVIQQNCGATTDFSYTLQLHQTGKKTTTFLHYESENGTPYASAEWKDNHTLIVYYDDSAKTFGSFEEESTYGGNTILLKKKNADVTIPASYLMYVKQHEEQDVTTALLYDQLVTVYWKEIISGAQRDFMFDQKGNPRSSFPKQWLVIGDLNGEIPLVMHKNDLSGPIFVATYNKETWSETSIADSYKGLQRILHRIDKETANFTGEDDPPLSSSFQRDLLSLVESQHGDRSFWSSLLQPNHDMQKAAQ